MIFLCIAYWLALALYSSLSINGGKRSRDLAFMMNFFIHCARSVSPRNRKAPNNPYHVMGFTSFRAKDLANSQAAF